MSQNNANDTVFFLILGVIVGAGGWFIVEKTIDRKISQKEQQVIVAPKNVSDDQSKFNQEVLNSLKKLNDEISQNKKNEKEEAWTQSIKELKNLLVEQGKQIETLQNKEPVVLTQEKIKIVETKSNNSVYSERLNKIETNSWVLDQKVDELKKQLVENQKVNQALLDNQQQMTKNFENYQNKQKSNEVVNQVVPQVNPAQPVQAPAKVAMAEPVVQPPAPKMKRTLPEPERKPAFKPNDRLD